MLQDWRFAIRMLLKQPGFSLIAALTLALGIGATSAVFSLIQGVLLTPPPYQQPEKLVLIPTARTDRQKMDNPRGWAAQQWLEWNKEAKSFQGIAPYGWTFNFLIRNDASESMQGMEISKNYFQVMGLKPAAGRGFEESDFGQGPVKAIVLGYEFWQRAFGGDKQIIGKTVRISRWEAPPTVIGVMEPGVRFLPSPGAAKEPNYDVNATVDFWVPADPNPKYLKDPYWSVVARLREGATPQQGQTELAVLAAREAQSEKEFEGFTPRLELVTDEMNRDGRRILLPLLGAAVLVLLIACGNVAALLLVRGLQRQQEYAVRSAMGMGRVALLRQVLTESLLLAVLGWSFGVGRSAVGRSDGRLGSFGLGTWGSSTCGVCRGRYSGAANVSVGSDGSTEKRRAERDGGNRGEALAAGSHDATDGADVGAAGGRGVADSHNGENCEGAVGVQHKSNPDDERDGGAKLVDLEQLSSTSAGARCSASGCAVRGVCLGSPADGKQLASNAGD
jgi:predicted permease